MEKKILIVAGEASSDLFAGNIVCEIKKLLPEAKFFGLGGAQMQQAGVNLYANIVDLAVVGFVEVLKNIRKFIAIFDGLLRQVDKIKPHLAILVDYPGFNLRLARELKKRNIPAVYYISPQLWAWGGNRIKLIKRYVERIIVIFKFEEAIYKAEGIPVNFVGHPLLDIVKPTGNLNLPPGRINLALLPGSRENEVRNNLPIMLETARIITEKISNISLLLLRSSSIKRELFDEILTNYKPHTFVYSEDGNFNATKLRGKLPIYILSNRTYEGLMSCDLALVASGSATLEAAILEKPFVIIYKVSFASWFFLRPIIKVPYIGLVNIIAGKKIVEEFVQYKACPKRIATYIMETLNNPKVITSIRKELSQIKSLLGEKGASQRAASIIVGMLCL